MWEVWTGSGHPLTYSQTRQAEPGSKSEGAKVHGTGEHKWVAPGAKVGGTGAKVGGTGERKWVAPERKWVAPGAKVGGTGSESGWHRGETAVPHSQRQYSVAG